MLKKIISISNLLLLLASCVPPKESDKIADCAANETFNARTRKCETFGKAPVAVLKNFTIYEDSSFNELLLEYVDANSDEAISCSVTEISNNIEVQSPSVLEIPAEMASFADQIDLLAQNASAEFPTVTAYSFNTKVFAEMTSDSSNSSIISAMETSLSNAFSVIILCLGSSSNANVNKARQLQLWREDLLVKLDEVKNRCQCLGGSCKSIVTPKQNYYGFDNFFYSIIDATGNSSQTKEVLVNTLSQNDRPFPVSSELTFNESIGDPVSQNITLNVARDIEDDITAFLFSYTLDKAPLNGELSNCMNLPGSSGPSDLTCVYTPYDGDQFGIGVKAATSFESLNFTAWAEGTFGNGISIKILEHPFKYIMGSNSGADSLMLDVVSYNTGTNATIHIYAREGITLCSEIRDAIKNHPQASALVDVSCSDPNHVLSGLYTGDVYLVGGVDGADSFTYRVYDGLDNSEYFATVMLNIIEQDDPPRLDLASMNMPINIDEDDRTYKIELKYTNPLYEPEKAESCELSNFSSGIRGLDCYCDTDGKCWAQVINSPENTTGPESFEFTLTDGTSYLTAMTSEKGKVDVIFNPVNDPPLPIHQDVTFNESAMSLPVPIPFVVQMPYDADGDNVYFTIVDYPTQGTLSDCNLQQSNLSCTYTPNDGNSSGLGLKSGSITSIGYVNFEMKASGSIGDGYNIHFIREPSPLNTQPHIYIDGQSIEIAIQDNTLSSDVVTLVNSHPVLSRLMVATDNGPSLVQPLTSSPVFLTGGAYGYDFFTYKVSDLQSDSPYNGSVNFNVNQVNDMPVVCPYSNYNTAPECGMEGCIRENTGPNSLGIVPSKLDLRFYYREKSICYKSISTTTAPYWEAISNFDNLFNTVVANEKDLIIIGPIKIDEGGGDINEDVQTLTLNSISSSDELLVPLSNITVSYAGSVINGSLPASFGDNVESDDLEDLYVKIRPAGGKYGEANITLQVADSLGTTVNIIIPLIINPVSANHGGWTKLESIGPALDKDGILYNQDYVCSYSRDKCNGSSACTGGGSPEGSVTPSMKNTVYFDSSNKNCYYSTGTTSDDWVKFKTTCNISPIEYQKPNCQGGGCKDCEGATCILEEDPRNYGLIPEYLDSFVYDRVNDKCWRSINFRENGGTILDWEEYNTTGVVSLKWNEFIVTGSGSITGHNVYRRPANQDFDYSRPINKQTLSASERTFVDNAENSWFPPVPKTVYYYEVRPLIQYSSYDPIPTGTLENFSVARLLVPEENLVFVHRWMANMKMCESINSTSDPTQNYRCAYEGPGDSNLHSTLNDPKNYYDIGYDYLVDRVESGCPYSPASTCNTLDGTCIGMNDPDGLIDAEQYSIYYGRTSGKCFLNVSTGSGTHWRELNAATLSGCNYSQNSCIRTDNPAQATYENCIGSFDPTSFLTAAQGALYYQETTGRCYQNTDGGTTWSNITPTTLVDSDKVPGDVDYSPFSKSFKDLKLPPLTHISQAQAASICSHRSLQKVRGARCKADSESTADPSGAGNYGATHYNSTSEECFVGTGNAWVKTSFPSSIPTRKLQMAYSQWDKSDLTDSSIQTLEMGLSLISSSKCNSSQASGLGDYYSESDIPDSSTFFSVTGTKSSQIRSVMTGSTVTSDCKSLFGVQDTVGNVMEWVSDRFLCSSSEHNCRALISDDKALGLSLMSGTPLSEIILPMANNDMRPGLGNDFGDGGHLGYDRVRFDGYLGPCVDLEADGVCDSPLENWKLEDEYYNGNRFFIPMGLLGHVDFPTFNKNSVVAPYMVEIGTTAGITPLQLHGDDVEFNVPEIYASHLDGCAAMATGGSYLSGDGAGVFHYKFLPCSESAFLEHDGIRFFKKYLLGNMTSSQLTILIPSFPDAPLSVITSIDNDADGNSDDIVVVASTNSNGEVVSTGRDIIAAINNDTEASKYIYAVEYDSTLAAGIISYLPGSYVDQERASDTMAKAQDVGFRCIAPVGQYDE